jgi:hypothetical protein
MYTSISIRCILEGNAAASIIEMYIVIAINKRIIESADG